MAPQDRRTPVDRVVRRSLEGAGVGRPLPRQVTQSARTVEGYLRASDPPRWMQRLAQIDHGIKRERAALARVYAELRKRHRDDPGAFAARWREHAEAQRYEELNELIREHNEWYPVERNLPVDLRTRDYVLIHGRSYRRPVLGPDWVLEQFPARP